MIRYRVLSLDAEIHQKTNDVVVVRDGQVVTIGQDKIRWQSGFATDGTKFEGDYVELRFNMTLSDTRAKDAIGEPTPEQTPLGIGDYFLGWPTSSGMSVTDVTPECVQPAAFIPPAPDQDLIAFAETLNAAQPAPLKFVPLSSEDIFLLSQRLAKLEKEVAELRGRN